MARATRTKPGPRKPRARRKGDAEWKKHRKLLIRLYREYPLNDVMTYMEAKHCFVASYVLDTRICIHASLHADTHRSRQYGYRFDLWDIRKYRTGVRRNSNRPITEMDKFVNNAEGDDSFASQTPETSSDNSLSQTSESENGFVDNDGEFADDSLIIFNWTPDEEKRKLAADFCSIMNDQDTAFQLYSNLYNSTRERPDASWMAEEILLVSCVRAAHGPNQVREAKRMLAEHFAQSQEPEKSFVLSMLEAHISERSGDAESGTANQTDEIIAFLVGQIDANGKIDGRIDKTSLIPISNGTRSYDTIGFQYLFHGAKAYENRIIDTGLADGTCGSSFSSQYFLGLYTSPTDPTHVDDCRIALRSCIEWCSTQLKSNPRISAGDLLPELSRRQGLRGEDIQLFSTLWCAMCQAISNDSQTISSDKNTRAWYRDCEFTLNVSPSELLAVICCMIGDKGRENSLDAGILQRAVVGAQDLLDQGNEGDQWMTFLRTFISMNVLVKDPSQQDENLTDVARNHVRSYVSSRLGIELQTPTPDPIPEMDFLDIMQSNEEMFQTQFGLPMMDGMPVY